MTDDVELLGRAMAATGDVLRGITPDQYGRSTPCPQWTVRDLVNHLIIGNAYFGESAAGRAPDRAMWSEDRLGDRPPAEIYDESARSALAEWRAGDTGRAAPLPGGGTGPRVLDMHMLEEVMHGWDLATATGQDRQLDAEVAQVLYDRWYGKLPDIARSTAFGPPADAPADAPLVDRLAAYLGRRV